MWLVVVRTDHRPSVIHTVTGKVALNLLDIDQSRLFKD